MSTKFINECKNGANCNRLGKICVETNKTATGNNLGLSNTIDEVVSKLKIKGYTKQNSYSGKNLFFNSDTFNDVNIQGNIDTENTLDGSYSIMTDKAWQGPYLDLKSITEKNHLKVGDRVTYSVYFKTNFIPTKDMKFAFYRAIAWEENVPRKTIEQASVIPNKWQRLSFTIELTEYSLTALIARIEAEYYTDSSDYSFGNNHENKIWFACPQFEKDETATNYEPYVGGTPSPNPDYPQEIEVGRGKNLLSEKTETLNNTYFYKDKGYKVKSGTTYMLSCNTVASGLYVRNLDNTSLFTAYNKKVLKFIPTKDELVFFDFYYQNTSDKSTEYQLEEGKTATEYEPYNSIVCKSTGKNLLKPYKNNELNYIGADCYNDNNRFYIKNTFVVNPSKATSFRIYPSLATANYSSYISNVDLIDDLTSGTYTLSIKVIKCNISEDVGYIAFAYRTDKLQTNLSSKTFARINESSSNTVYTETFEVTENCPFSLFISFNREKEITYECEFEVQLEKSSIATEYEPYKESKIAYHLGENFLADKDYIENSKLHKNIGKYVLDGTESFVQPWSEPSIFRCGKVLPSKVFEKLTTNVICKSDCYVATHYDGGDGSIWRLRNDNNYPYLITLTDYGSQAQKIMIKDNRFTTPDELKAWLSEHPVEVYYELAEEQVIDLETEGILELYSPETNLSNNIDSEMEIKYTNYETEITNSDNLSSFTVDDTCYVDGKIIGTNYIKKVQSQLVAVPNDVDLIDKKVFVKTGVKYDDLSTEWLDMGKYTIERPKDEQTANLTQITAYDDFNMLDKPYVCNLDFNNPVYVADFYSDVCKQLGLVPETTEFLNSDIQINANPFVNNESLRIVLQEIEKVSCSYGEIDLETNKIKLSWLSQSETPDYEFKTSDYTSLEGGKIIYGPVNCLVIKESQIEGENTVRQDEQSIAKDGETQIAIEDSYFLFTQALREQAIDNIWNRVKGLTYVDCIITTSYGKPFFKKGMKIRINVNDGRVFDTYVLKHTFTYDGTYQSVIESPALTKQETKIKSQSISEVIRLTQIEVDKAKGTITATAKKTQDIEDSLNNNYYSKSTVNEMIMNSETGVTNTFSEAGGNNVFRNTGLWFGNDSDTREINPYEFWNGKVIRKSNDEAANNNSMLIQKGSLTQEQEVPNGNYSISFYYKKLIEQANASVLINDIKYPLDSLETKQFYTGEIDNETGEYITQPIVVTSNHIKIEFKSDINNAVEVWDLMCNKGTVKLAWSQNQNETTTETVNISKGITITSTNMETIFRANANGIKILTLQEATIAYFTDKGLSTNEIIVNNKAQICGTLINEVEEQTWFTRM